MVLVMAMVAVIALVLVFAMATVMVTLIVFASHGDIINATIEIGHKLGAGTATGIGVGTDICYGSGMV